MSKLSNKLGLQFGRLYVYARAENSKNGNARWHCVCACGNEIIAHGIDLSRNTNSCGCLRKELTSEKFYKDGRTKHPLYKTWIGMINRCHNPLATGFNNYGGRLIFVCDRWQNSFWDFVKDVGDKPSERHTIDRINNNEGYNPNNCKWSTYEEQVKNSRPRSVQNA